MWTVWSFDAPTQTPMEKNLIDAIVLSSLRVPFSPHSSVSLPSAAPVSPLRRLPEYTRCCSAKHPLGPQQSQTEGSGGGGGGGENDKRAHGGSWGQLKITRRRGGESDGESAGTTMRETQAGLYLDVLRMKCFAVWTGEESFNGTSIQSNQTMAHFRSRFIINTMFKTWGELVLFGVTSKLSSFYPPEFVAMAIRSPQYCSVQVIVMVNLMLLYLYPCSYSCRWCALGEDLHSWGQFLLTLSTQDGCRWNILHVCHPSTQLEIYRNDTGVWTDEWHYDTDKNRIIVWPR